MVGQKSSQKAKSPLMGASKSSSDDHVTSIDTQALAMSMEQDLAAPMVNSTKTSTKSRARKRALNSSRNSENSGLVHLPQIENSDEFDADTLEILRSAHDVANDAGEEDEVAQLISKNSMLISQNPTGMPRFAVVASMLWLLGTTLWAFVYPLTLGLPEDQLFATSRIVMFAIATILPIALFISAAMFLRRANEMAQASQVLAHSALRLMDPETMAHGTIASVGGAVRREISALSDGVERAIARAGELETMVQSEVSAIESAYSENEIRLRELIDNLVEQRGAIFDEGEKLKSLITESQSALADRIGHASQQLVQMVEHAGTQAGTSLEARSHEIAEHLMGVSAKVLAALSERTDDVTSNLTSAEKNISSSIQSAGEVILATVSDRISNLTTELDIRGTTLIESLAEQEQRLETTFNKTGTTILDGIMERSQDANNALKLTAENLLTDIMLRGTELSAKWDEIGTKIGKNLQDQTIEATAKLSAGQDLLSVTINETLTAIEGRIAASETKLSTSLETTVGVVEARMAASEAHLSSSLQSQAELVSGAIVEQRKDTAETLGKIAVDVSTAIGNQISDIQNSIDIRVEGLLSQIGIQGEQLSGALDERLAALSSALEQSGTHLESGHELLNSSIEKLQSLTTESLANSTTQLAEILKSTVIETGDELLRKTSDALGTMQTGSTTAIETLTTKIDTFESRIIEGTKTYSDSWDTRLIGLDERVAVKLQEVFTQFDERISRVDEALVQRTRGLNDVFVASTSALAETLSTGASSTLSEIDKKTSALAALLDEKRDVFSQYFDAHNSVSQHMMDSHSAALKISLEETIAALEAHINKDASLIANTLGLHTTQMVHDIRTQSELAADALRTRTQELESALIARTQAMESLVNGDLANVNAGLSAKTAELAELITEKGQGFISQINADGTLLAQRIEASASKAVELLSSTNDLFNQTLNSGLTELGKTVLETHQALKNTLANEGQESVEAMRATQTALSLTLTDAVEKLNTQNVQLTGLVHNAQEQLKMLGTELGSNISQFHDVTTGAAIQTEETLLRLSHQVNLLHKTTNNAMREAQDITKGFDEQNQAMASTMDAMSINAHTVNKTLMERREGLTHIAQLIVGAAAEIDGKIGDATARIDDSLNMTTGHVERLTTALGHMATQTSQDVLAQFERMTLAAGDESMRTTEAVKRAYEDVAEEMSRSMRLASEEFAQSASGLKSLVLDVQHEINATREALTVSLKQLPAETQENTAELRRVVADQLRALNDLSDLIARQSSRLDVSAPEVSQPRAVTPAPRAAVEVEAKAKPAWFTAPRTTERAPIPSPSVVMPFDDEDDFASFVKPTVTATTPRASAENSDTNWLRDLLNRAEDSHEEIVAENAPAPNVPAHPFGADLASAVDAHALADAWERYRNGERGVFNRRLYSVSGQSTFDEVRRRFRRDGEFRTSVERYCQDFEKLLSAVAKNDKNGTLLPSYLSSDTGKVYTLLAHAAGRVE